MHTSMSWTLRPQLATIELNMGAIGPDIVYRIPRSSRGYQRLLQSLSAEDSLSRSAEMELLQFVHGLSQSAIDSATVHYPHLASVMSGGCICHSAARDSVVYDDDTAPSSLRSCNGPI